MDAKDLRKEPSLGERNNDGTSSYNQSGAMQGSTRTKTYQDACSSPMAKVEMPAARPCAVIGPDRVVAAPDSRKAQEPWPADAYRRPPDYPYKPFDYQHPTRNISPRQTFQENMQRIMVPPSYANRLKEDHNFQLEHNISQIRNNKLNLSTDAKYCDVPYVNSIVNDPKNVRTSDVSVPSINSVPGRSVQGWPPIGAQVRPSKPFGASDIYQYPDYTSCTAPRPMFMARPHRTVHEEPGHAGDPYYPDGSNRFKPYPTVKERYPHPRYDYIGNYTNPIHAPPPFPPHKAIPPTTYPGYSQVPLKFMDTRMGDPVMNAYQRPPNPQPAYNNMSFRNQVIHPSYGPIQGNCLQTNKFYPYPDTPTKPMTAAKLPPYPDYEANRPKPYPVPDGFYLNDITRHHSMKSQVAPNYPTLNMHVMHPHPYYRKDNIPMKNFEYGGHFRNIDPSMNANSNSLPRFTSQFSNTVPMSPSEMISNSINMPQPNFQEDIGYVSQLSSANAQRSFDSGMSRVPIDPFRRYDFNYGSVAKTSQPKCGPHHSGNQSSKDKKDLDVRQFLQMWNEGEEEGSENNTKDHTGNKSVSLATGPGTQGLGNYQESGNQEQLYVMGIVNVPSEELSKYEHIQKVSKLPENIKGYNSIEILHKFEEVIESSNLNYQKPPAPLSRGDFRLPLKSTTPFRAMTEIAMPQRPLSPLDVEAKISQSVIHKEVGCNFEIKPCSPKMLSAESATPVQNVISERTIEKINNLMTSTSSLQGSETTNVEIVVECQNQTPQKNSNMKITCCEMAGTQYSKIDIDAIAKPNYSLQDLESNSGVCLASLPRLDNDIELNFPEVNQQFINANKMESVITPTPPQDLPQLDVDQESIGNQIQSKNDREQPKLNKYRKIRPSMERYETQTEQNIQSIRTDSVIIKNPETNKRNEETRSPKTVLNEDPQENPSNMIVNKAETMENDSKVDEIDNDFVIDFSVSSNERSSEYNELKCSLNERKNSRNVDQSESECEYIEPIDARNDFQGNDITQIDSSSGDSKAEDDVEDDEDRSSTPTCSNSTDNLEGEDMNIDVPLITKGTEFKKNADDKSEGNLDMEKDFSDVIQDTGVEKVTFNANDKMIDLIQHSPQKSQWREASFESDLITESRQETLNMSSGHTDKKQKDQYLELLYPKVSNAGDVEIFQDSRHIFFEEPVTPIYVTPENSIQDDDDIISIPESEITELTEENQPECITNYKHDIRFRSVSNFNKELFSPWIRKLILHEAERCVVRPQNESKDRKDSDTGGNFDVSKNFKGHSDISENITDNMDLKPNYAGSNLDSVQLVPDKKCFQDGSCFDDEALKKTLSTSSLRTTDDVATIKPESCITEGLPKISEPQSGINLEKPEYGISKTMTTKRDSFTHHLNSDCDVALFNTPVREISPETEKKPVSFIEESSEEEISHKDQNKDLENSDGSSTSAVNIETSLVDSRAERAEKLSSDISPLSDYSKNPSNYADKRLVSESYSLSDQTMNNTFDDEVPILKLDETQNVVEEPDQLCFSHSTKQRVISDVKRIDTVKRIPINCLDAIKNEYGSDSEEYFSENEIERFKASTPVSEKEPLSKANQIENVNTKDFSETSSNINIDEGSTEESECKILEQEVDANDTIVQKISDGENIAMNASNTKEILIKEVLSDELNMNSMFQNTSATSTDDSPVFSPASASQESVQHEILNNALNFEPNQNLCNNLCLSKQQSSLKRSLSDSDLNSIKQTKTEASPLCGMNKRRKFMNAENKEMPQIIADSYGTAIQSRRNSLSSICDESNVSFCIFIDKDCLLPENCTESEKIQCITELAHDCLSCVQNDPIVGGIDSSAEIVSFVEEMNEYSNNFGEDCTEDDRLNEESWVNDVACVETVVSDDIAEDIIVATSPPSELSTAEYDDDESDILNINDHSDKVKYIYGDKMCSNDSQLLETLYRTPQMNVNKKLVNRESQNADEGSRYYDREALEKVLSESNTYPEAICGPESVAFNTSSLYSPCLDVLENDKENIDLDSFSSPNSPCDRKGIDFGNSEEFVETKTDDDCDKTQDDTVHSCESSIDNVFSYSQRGESPKCVISSSPEVSSTTSEEKNSSILLKITNLGGARVSHVSGDMHKRISCKYTETNDYLNTDVRIPARPLITKAAQKYIPPLKEALPNLKVKLSLPQHSLIRLKQMKLAKETPTISIEVENRPNVVNTENKPNNVVNIEKRSNLNVVNTFRKDVPKKIKPKFEDVLKSIEEVQIQMHKEKSKKMKKAVPKVVIKKSCNGSHYASTSNSQTTPTPDLTGRKWQPWVFLEKNNFIDKMALKGKIRAVFNHRKKTYVLAETFKKYKSIASTKFVISKPKLDKSSNGRLKYTIRLKHG